ncbi:hypothetical protein ACXZ1K_05255 [Pedobacter sp. PWIIR3]
MKTLVILICLPALIFCKSSFAQVKPSLKPIKIDSIKIDSVFKSKLRAESSALKAKFKDKISSIKDSSGKFLNIDKSSRAYLANLNKKKNDLKDSLRNNRSIKLQNLAVDNSFLLNNGLNNLTGSSKLYNVSVYAQLKISKFPLALDISNNSNFSSGLSSMKDALFKVNLDKSQFQQVYQNDLDKFSRFKNMELSGLDIPGYLKKNIIQKMSSSALSDISKFPQLNAALNDSKQITALLEMDEQQLKRKLDQLMEVKEQTATNKLDSLSSEKIQQLKLEADQKKQEITNVILSLKQKMQSSGLDQRKLLLIQKFISNKGDVKDLQSMLENELMTQEGQSPAGRLYSRVKEFQVGSFGQKIPGLLNREALLNGTNFSLNTSRGPVNLGVGVNKESEMPKDVGFNRSLFSVPKLVTYASIPASNFAFGSGKLSWVGSFDKQSNGGLNLQNAVPRNGSAFIVSQNVNFNAIGKFTVEMSKSSTQYKNVSVAEADKLVLNNDLKMGNYFRDDFLQTVSLGMKHNVDVKKLGLTANSFFSYSGLGYQNPGQQGYGNMGLRMGGSLKKSFMRNRLILNARTDLKNTPLSAVSHAHWKNYNVQFDSRYRISRSYSVNLKYGENGVDKVDGMSAAVFSSQKLQADLNANYKLGDNYGFSHLSVGKQLMLNPGLITNTNFATVIYSQTIVLKAFSLSGNAFYNKELSGAQVLGDMMNADFGCQYTIFRNVNISSAVTYLDNENIARQAGIRQTIQLSAFKNFDISAFLDVRKNLINPLYPDLFATGRGELSIRYFLNR